MDAASLLGSQLDERQLERLCRDLLFLRGHTQARIVNGPGDGGRDIHSLDATGRKHVAQSKFHADRNRACSSGEMGELPLAMTKFGAVSGLFVTNARCAPQGKREFIEDFGGLELEFLDGAELASAVLDHPILRALWLDGSEIAKVNRAVAYPVLIRRHDDAPVFLPRYFGDAGPPSLAPTVAWLKGHYPDLQIRIHDGDRHVVDFPRYRPSKTITMNEGLLRDRLKVLEVAFRGPYALDELQTLASFVAKAIVGWLAGRLNELSVFVGVPRLIRLDSEGASYEPEGVPIPIEPVCYVQSSSSAGEEYDWFSAYDAADLTSVNDAHVTQADWIRLYSPALDICVGYEIYSLPMYGSDGMQRLYASRIRRAWEDSLFALVPYYNDWHFGCPEPDEAIPWPYDGRVLCGWYQYPLLGGLFALDDVVEPEIDVLGYSPADFGPLLEQLERAGFEIVAPAKARHMVAVAGGHDPFEEPEVKVFRTAEVVTSPEALPRPILPGSRRFFSTCVWRTDLPVERWRELPTIHNREFEDATFERWEDFVEMTVELQSPPTLSTQAVLLEALNSLVPALVRLEAEANESAPAIRATQEYWAVRHNINLGLPSEASDKQYSWHAGEGPPPMWLQDLARFERETQLARERLTDEAPATATE
jgi:hypothetical protein